MTTRDMQCFQTIVDEKSITKAAKALYMSPQGLSKQLKNLENELDCELLIRTKNGIQLTEAGEVFYERTKKMLSDYSALQKALRSIEGKSLGAVDLLSAYGILRFVTPDCIMAFRQKYPDIEFNYREYPDLSVERKFNKGDGNIAFTLAPVDEKLYDCITLFQFPLKLMVNKKHPLAQRSSVTIQDLKGENLYLESSEFKLYHNVVGRCRAAGFEPNICFETSGFSLCHKMCRDNKGITVTVDFVSKDLSGGELAGKDLVLLPFSDGEYIWKACMLTRKGETIPEAVTLFRKHVEGWISDIHNNIYIR